MNIKNLSALFLTGLIPLMAEASPLTPEEALSRLNGKDAGIQKFRAPAQELKLVNTHLTPNGKAASYVFVPEGNNEKGFIILSADNLAYPVLGYNDDGQFDPYNIPPQLEAMLEYYAEQIERARIYEATSLMSIPQQNLPLADAGLEPINPLIKTQWDQDEPYYYECPTYFGKYCYTGCVATAMAQIMNYYKYPEVGAGAITYQPETLNQTLYLNFQERPFDWDNMLNIYKSGQYTQEEADAVAYLMKACGYSVKMRYSISSSGAMGLDVVPALVNNFKYDPSARYVSRITYSAEEWAKIIYDNLKDVGPMLYDGTSPAGGHSFVCDGFDGKGYFHFNWGWSGLSDGYYSLDALNPRLVGIGGYAGGFNLAQHAVLGLRVPDGKNYAVQANLFQDSSTTATLDGDKINFYAEKSGTGVTNMAPNPVKMGFGAIFSGVSDPDFEPLAVKGTFGVQSEVTLQPAQSSSYSTYNHPVVTIPDNLPAGEYKVTLATIDQNFVGAELIPINVIYGYRNYVLLEKDEEGAYSLKDVAPANITVEAADFENELIYGVTNILKVKVSNHSDVTLTRALWPIFEYDVIPVLYGDTNMVTVPAGETVEAEWLVSLGRLEYWFVVDKPYTLGLKIYDAEFGDDYGFFGIKTVYPQTGYVNIDLENFYVDKAQSTTGEVDGENVTVYVVEDPENITVRITLVPSGSYFNGDLIITAAGAGDSDLSTGEEEIFRQNYGITNGSRLNTRVNVAYQGMQVGEIYKFTLYCNVNGTVTELGSLYLTPETSGIDSITDFGTKFEYYNMQGQKVQNPQKGQLLIRTAPGKKGEKVIY